MPLSASPASVVTAAYTRLTEVLPMLTVTELGREEPAPEGDGWAPVAGLAGGCRAGRVPGLGRGPGGARLGRRARPDVVASFGLHRYAWPACLLITLPWFLQRRVPRFPVDHVAFQRSLGRMAVRTGAFTCLPGDPAADLPGARVVADEEALRAEVREAVAEHLGPVLPDSGRACGGGGVHCGARRRTR